MEQPVNLQLYVEKVSLYSKHLYTSARQEGGGKRVRKYARKLLRVAQQFQRHQQ